LKELIIAQKKIKAQKEAIIIEPDEKVTLKGEGSSLVCD